MDTRKYYLRHKEKMNAASRAAYQANKPARNEYGRRKHAENREAANEKRRQWHRDHKDHSSQKVREWRQKNLEAVQQHDRERHAANRETANADRRKRAKRMKQEKPWCRILHSRKHHAKKKEIPFSLTDEWAESVWTGKCALTGIPFVSNNRHGGFYSPSIDKIDPKVGYTPENSRFILNAINAMKGMATDSDVLRVAHLLVKNSTISDT